jgi:HEAT repeat protein
MALALGTRRSTIAAVASALAAMALAAAVAGRSCRVTQPGPEVTVRDLLQAAKTGDRDAIFELLTPATRARLDAEARRATDLVGGSVRYTAKDLVSIGAGDPSATPTDITLIEEHGDRATVEIVSAAGRARLVLFYVDGRWRVDLANYGSAGL